MKTIRIGCGAGYSGDRIEPAVELAARGQLDYLVFECLAERTIAMAQQARRADPSAGFDPLLVDRLDAVLPACVAGGVTIITNMGAANPRGAAGAARDLARRLGFSGLTVAAVTGDDVLDLVRRGDYRVAETGESVASLGDALVSANAYTGAESLLPALAMGARVIVAGRVADPSLFVAPLRHEFGWAEDHWSAIGRATVVGHLLECAGQVTGGYYADPGRKSVPDLGRLGFPLAVVDDAGAAVITKVADSGGRVTVGTCTEQLLYEVHDPAAYVTPDVVADFSRVCLTKAGDDAVRVSGATGRERPATLKVALGCRDGFIGEGQISYAGPGAIDRARLALQIVADRVRLTGLQATEIRYDLIGVDALHGTELSRQADPYDVRVRVSAHTTTLKDADRIGNEVEALYTNGPAGGGGAVKSSREVLAIRSTFVPRERVSAGLHVEEA